jgi:hypothetical protein
MTWTILAALDLGLLATSAGDIPPEVRRAYGLMLLLVCGTLFAVFLLTIVLIRALRRYRGTFLNRPRKPTANEDLWSQHRLPKELQEDQDSGQSSQE